MSSRWLLLAWIVLGATGCADQHGDSERAGAVQASAADPARGPRGGRLFKADDIQLELRLSEEDGPPQFLAYLYDPAGRPAGAREVALSVTLERFAGRREVIPFTSAGGHLRGEGEVREPHSFVATLALHEGGHEHTWSFEQVEHRVTLAPEAVTLAGLVSEPVGSQRLDVRVEAPGEVRLNSENVLLVRPRFAGMVLHLRKHLGDPVARGDTLAVIQSNESLQGYGITSPIEGTIVGRTGTVGAAVDFESVLYMVADLSSVWVDFAIYPQHVGVVRRGHKARITAATAPDLVATGTISYVGPLLEQETRVSYGRIVVPNPDGRWQPGLYATVSILVESVQVPVAVPEAAIVRSRFGPAVFRSEGSTFELQPVRVGRSDGLVTEITGGLAAGERIVTANAFLLKAELGRSEAAHEH